MHEKQSFEILNYCIAKYILLKEQTGYFIKNAAGTIRLWRKRPLVPHEFKRKMNP